jgi:K+-sensing histidine kinase KdpD
MGAERQSQHRIAAHVSDSTASRGSSVSASPRGHSIRARRRALRARRRRGPAPDTGTIRDTFVTLVQRPYTWLRANTFAPSWLPPRVQSTASYLVALSMQVLALLMTWRITMLFPSFAFAGMLPLLAVVLAALTFGAAPSLLATMVGGAVLLWVVVPPHFAWSLSNGTDVVGAVVYLLTGIIVSGLASRTERARQQAAADRAWLDATVQTIADGVFVLDARGFLKQMNTAARALSSPLVQRSAESLPLAERLALLDIRDETGESISITRLPASRILRGEVLTGERAADVVIADGQGQDLLLNITGAPIRDAKGHIRGAVIVSRDVTERRRLERRTQESLSALLAIAEALVHIPAPPAAPAQSAPDIARRLAGLTRSVLGGKRVLIATFDEQTGRLAPVASVGLTAEQERLWREDSPEQAPLSLEKHPNVLERLRASQPVIVDMSQPPCNEEPNPLGVATGLIVPMLVAESLVGLLLLDYDGERHVFAPDEVALAGAVGKLAALVLERERLLRERAEAHGRELALQRINAQMQTFLGVAGHELRTPVTTIKASVQMARNKLQAYLTAGLQEGRAEALSTAQALLERAELNGERLIRLIEDLVDISRIQAGKLELRLEPCDLGAVVREVVETQRLAWPGRQITLTLPEQTPPLLLDAFRIGQVVTNYLTNALKYSGEKDPVAVRVSPVDGRLQVAVQDSGPGLSAEAQQQIWEPYYQLPTVRQQAGGSGGLGLGLYICRTIIEQHGGQTGVKSWPGEGSIFWFELPGSPQHSEVHDTPAGG